MATLLNSNMAALKTKSQTRIRLAKLSDARQMALLSRLEIEDGLGWSWTPDRIRAEIRASTSIVLAAVEGRRLTGFALMRIESASAHLCLLAVAKGWRRRGLARRLLITLSQLCQGRRCRQIRLEVRRSNLEARALYRASGFRLVASIPGYYENKEAAAVMALDLPQVLGRENQPVAPAFCA